MRRRSRAALVFGAALAALAGTSAVQTVAPAGTDANPNAPAARALPGSQKNERPAPTQITARLADLGLDQLGAAGVPFHFAGVGCPWPGYRAAMGRRCGGACRRVRGRNR